jgi:hypothetical protein
VLALQAPDQAESFEVTGGVSRSGAAAEGGREDALLNVEMHRSRGHVSESAESLQVECFVSHDTIITVQRFTVNI